MPITSTRVAMALAVLSSRPKLSCSHSAMSWPKNASPMMPFRMPMEVMPIWMVDRKRVGFSASFTAAAARPSPCRAAASRRGLRAVSSATSHIASRPFSRMRQSRMRNSTGRSGAVQQHFEHEAAADVREEQHHEAR